jgi:glycosyltransferase involved in cell wall biosynthesis
MPIERIFTGYDVVDNDYFCQRSLQIRNSKSETRKKYGLPENYFLASARFIEKKNLPRLIGAYAEYRQLCRASVSDAETAENAGDPPSPTGLRPAIAGLRRVERLRRTSAPWDLVLLGDGPLKSDLCHMISDLCLNGHVHLPGFKQYDELPVYYALASAFVHPSTTEQWGLVVNEAIASGLPVIVSERCGCVPELVNGNGFVFDPTDEHELASLLLKMATLSDDDRRRFADASYKIAANFAPERFGDGLERAARMALELTSRRSGIVDRALLFAAAKYCR